MVYDYAWYMAIALSIFATANTYIFQLMKEDWYVLITLSKVVNFESQSESKVNQNVNI